MIADLHIRNLGVIAEADVELSPGMVVFTGETGAGKTVLVGALGLVLGDRADTSVVMGDRADVSARILVDARGAEAERIASAGGYVEADGTATVTRTVSASGRGRAALGGAAVPVSALAELGQRVAQRHSQSDQIRLRSPRRQRESLDAFGGPELAAAAADYRRKYSDFLAESERLRHLQEERSHRQRRIAELGDGLRRIEEVNPGPDDDHLSESIARLANAESLGQSLAHALGALDRGDGGVLPDLTDGLKELQRAAGIDPGIGQHADRLAEVEILLRDIDSDLRRYADTLRADPRELDVLQQRKSALANLQRAFGPTVADVIAWADSARGELERLEGADGAESELLGRISDSLTGLVAAASSLSTLRSQAARRLAAAATAELRQLAMPHAAFSVEVRQHETGNGLALPDGRIVAFGQDGVDTVSFRLAPHQGATPSPIGDGASGGELSRIMLALEVVLAESDPPAVFVFDEVDAGIGGRTAVEVGRRLARLAQRSQVLVVTHLAQVAVFAGQHVVVRKDSRGRVTRSSVVEVAGEERKRELARMLSGQEQSTAALAHAAELLAVARGDEAADHSAEATL